MVKRSIFGTILAGGALALLLAFKTPSESLVLNNGNNSSAGSGKSTTYSGDVTGNAIQTPYGIVQVQLTLTNGRITEVTLLQAPQGGRDTQLTNYAVPQLRSEVLSAQSAQVDTISGATYTSQGYLQSVQSALDQVSAGFTGGVAAAPAATTATTDTGSGAGSQNGSSGSGNGSGSGGATSASTAAPAGKSNYSGTVTGQAVQIPFGTVQVQVTINSGRITDVTILQAPQGGRSGQIAQYAAPQLRSEVLSAQSAQVNTISGATYTSMGYLQSLQSALDQAGV